MSASLTLSGTQRHRLTGPGDRSYLIDLAVPPGEPPAGGWPALTLLDAFGCFATAMEALSRMSRRSDATDVQPMVIVGVSPAEGLDPAGRRRDFTTTPPGYAGDPEEVGGAPAFLHFLTGEVRRLAGQAGPLSPGRQALFGHSLAGFFTLWVLCTRPESFAGYVAASPSLWWDRHLLAPGQRLPTGRRVALLFGEWEDELPPWQASLPGAEQVRERRRARGMIASGRAFAEQLAQASSPGDVAFDVLPGEEHASIVSAAIPRALRLASRLGR